MIVLKPEVIGPPDCALIHRWTLYSGDPNSVKLMVHHFLPNADDRDVHDHPRPFWTLVVRGRYDDIGPCARCEQGRVGPVGIANGTAFNCPDCANTGLIVNERMRAGRLRLRPARHRHRTQVGPKGCWTIVLMGPIRRRWGFWRRGVWWFWRDYEAEFGFAMRCEDLDKEYRR